MSESGVGSKPGEPVKAAPGGSASPKRLAGILIYVVDDEPLVAEIVARVLSMAGGQPELFQNPVTAWETFKAANPRPKLLVTDFLMRSLNGMELIERCKQLEPGLKTILYSGNVGSSIIAGHSIQPDRFLNKPLKLEALVETALGLLLPSPPPADPARP